MNRSKCAYGLYPSKHFAIYQLSCGVIAVNNHKKTKCSETTEETELLQLLQFYHILQVILKMCNQLKSYILLTMS